MTQAVGLTVRKPQAAEMQRQGRNLLKSVVLLCAVALASCTSKVDRAQMDYEQLVADGGTPSQVCVAAQHVAEAYEEEDRGGAAHRAWQDKARAACLLLYRAE